MAKIWYSGFFAVTFALLWYRYFLCDVETLPGATISEDWEDILEGAKNHSLYEKKVVMVTEGVHVAMNFALANVIMIEGDDGIIIVDTTENPEALEEIMMKFRMITRKRIEAVILTHFHPDHIRGLDWFLKYADRPVKVFAHKLTAQEISKGVITATDRVRRAIKQFGVGLNKKATSKVPGPKLRIGKSDFVVPRPTHLVDDFLETTVSGVRLQLVHVPSETVDHIAVWIPDKSVLLPADMVYGAFPNIAPARGDFPRSAVDWFTSIDRVRHLNPEFLVPNHMGHIEGRDKVFEFLTNYRDAIQFVHDQTVRLTNQGLHVSDIVRQVKLPPSLVSKSYLQGYYGTVEWSVRAIHANYTGWFSGEAHELNPLTIKERAEKMRELLEEGASDGGGVDSMIRNSHANSKKSLENFDKTGEFLFIESQWALEVANTALVLSQEGSTEHERAKKANIDALVIMARYSVSMTAKNYYLTCAAELDGSFNPPDVRPARKIAINKVNIEDLLKAFTRGVNPEKCDSFVQITALLHFIDLKQTFGLMLRNCVIEFVNDKARIPKTFDVKIKMTSQLWRDFATNERSRVAAYLGGEIQAEGDWLKFKQITSMMNLEISTFV